MLKLFISYCHSDIDQVQRFVTHLMPFCQGDALFEVWYDKNILAGYDFWNEIDSHLAERDIICLLISADYLASKSCLREMERAFAMKQHRDCLVVPIILSECSWSRFEVLSKTLALPPDAKPVKSYHNEDAAWKEVVDHLVRSASDLMTRRKLSFSKSFEEFLNDASIFTKAHSSKAELKLSDIYIYPDLSYLKDDSTQPERVRSFDLLSGFSYGQRIIIIGEDQSGKTALAKVFTKVLKDRGMIPVFIRGENLQGNLDFKVRNLMSEEYDCPLSDSLNDDYIVPIIDDFHKAVNPDRILSKVLSFKSFILIVDEVYDLDYTNNDDLIGIQRYRIREFKPSHRNRLIKNWLQLRENTDSEATSINNDYALIDSRSRLVDDFLGKAQNQGIMPSYPFFILTALVTIEESEKPLDNSITSQGYCYQALIYFFLREQGVANDEIDSYINFLTEFSAEIYKKKDELTKDEYAFFVSYYKNSFVLTDDLSIMQNRLQKARIMRVSSLGNYSFEYPYLYYFFAGKFFAEQFDNLGVSNSGEVQQRFDVNREIDYIFENLHVTENAYIAIFIAHHSRNKRLIEKLLNTGMSLFADYSPVTLSKQELSFFNLSPIAIPTVSSNSNPEKEREKRLKARDESEEAKDNGRVSYKEDEDDNPLSKEIRRSIKTVDVIGRVLRNRSGSLRQSELIMMFKTGMNIHLRLISSFFEIINEEKERISTLKYIKGKIMSAHPDMSKEKCDKLAEKIFWNLNFGVVLGLLSKITFSLGSDKIQPIVNRVFEEQNNEATFIVQQAISMYFSKNLQIGDIERVIRDNSVSDVVKRMLLTIIVDYCQTHRIDYKDRARLMNLGIKGYLLNAR